MTLRRAIRTPLTTMQVGETKYVRWPRLYTYRKRRAREIMDEPHADWRAVSISRRSRRPHVMYSGVNVTRTR